MGPTDEKNRKRNHSPVFSGTGTFFFSRLFHALLLSPLPVQKEAVPCGPPTGLAHSRQHIARIEGQRKLTKSNNAPLVTERQPERDAGLNIGTSARYGNV